MKIPDLLTPKGGCDRFTWWTTTFGCMLLDALSILPILLLISKYPSPFSSQISIVLIGIALLFSLWVTFMIAAKRFRDIGFSPWLCLLYLIPTVGWVAVFIICGFFPSKTARRTKQVTRIVTKKSTHKLKT